MQILFNGKFPEVCAVLKKIMIYDATIINNIMVKYGYKYYVYNTVTVYNDMVTLHSVMYVMLRNVTILCFGKEKRDNKSLID